MGMYGSNFGYEEWEEWRRTKSPGALHKVLRKFDPFLEKELQKYGGNLPKSILKMHAKKFIIDALHTYKPEKGKLTTHIATNLQRLNRINYKTSSTLTISEEIQRGVNTFKQAKEELTIRLGREPTPEELSKELGWSISKILRTENLVRTETPTSALEVSPMGAVADDPIIDYFYHDLSPKEKIIFQHRIGYRGAPYLGTVELAKKLKTTPADISITAKKIAKKLKEVLGK